MSLWDTLPRHNVGIAKRHSNAPMVTLMVIWLAVGIAEIYLMYRYHSLFFLWCAAISVGAIWVNRFKLWRR